MKIWFGMQGDNTVAWQEWVSAVKKWGRAEQIHSYSGGIANMAEAYIRYDEAFRPSAQANLLHPVILDGWISGGLNAKSDGTRKIEHDDKLYASLRQDKAAI
ncbi:asparagine synthase, partial [Bacillus licheniformis]|nr:asparagine synthase [Bacillus licheniformis]